MALKNEIQQLFLKAIYFDETNSEQKEKLNKLMTEVLEKIETHESELEIVSNKAWLVANKIQKLR